ncbi:hypothetical protein ACA910_004050 [Epithemia clementina (nom. ined.)]
MALLLIYSFVVLPLAHPFVSGSTPSASLGNNDNVVSPTATHISTSGTKPTPSLLSPLAGQSVSVITASRGRTRFSALPLTESIKGASNHDGGKHEERKRWKFFPHRKVENTAIVDNTQPPDAQQKKANERDFPLFSRLSFSYIRSLIQEAKHRHLEVYDAFEVSEDRKMEFSVNKLTSIHAKLRQEAQTELQELKQQSPEKMVSAEAFLLSKALFLQQRRMLLLTGILRLFNTAIQAFPALLVARLLRLAEAGRSVPVSKAVQAALTLLSVLSVKMILENQYFHYVVRCATNVRGSLSGLIFDKALALPGGGSGVIHPIDTDLANKIKNGEANGGSTMTPAPIGSGGVLNLMQSDTGIIESAALQIHTIWDGILQLAMYTFLLYRILGPSVVYGCAVLLATIPMNSLTLRLLNRLSKYENEAKDARTKRTAESITNMKLLKLFGWEQNFADDIRRHRREELRRHVSRGVIRALNSAISNAVPALVLVVTLGAYAKSGNPVVASTIFTAISLFNQLRFPLFFYPMLIDSLANGKNAIRRIANFVATEEIVPYVQRLPPVVSEGRSGGAIEMRHGNFIWSVPQGGSKDKGDAAGDNQNLDESIPALARVNFKVSPGEIVAVVGSVGSGKSSVIKGLLGELNPVPGPLMDQLLSRGNESDQSLSSFRGSSVEQRPSVTIHGEVAYCSQEAWLPKGTIRDAITFGREYDKARYLSAVRDAGLDRDLVDELEAAADPKKGQLSHETDVGEHGSSLSGGQRARVALARALYASEAKVFLLDDCLAALDASVGSTVFERLSARLRRQNAAVLLVTNDPSLPRRCDRTLLMGTVGSSGSCCTIIDSGSYDQLIARGHDLRSISTTESDEDADNMEAHSPVFKQRYKSEANWKLAPPKLMKLNKDNFIRVEKVDDRLNRTWSSCHSHPESPLVMENCPVAVYEGRHEFYDATADPESLFFVEGPELVGFSYNSTDPLAPTIEPKLSLKVVDSSRATTSSPKLLQPMKLKSMDDSMTTGAVPVSTYVSYFKAVRQPLLIAAMLLSFLTVNSAQFFQQYTVARWTDVASGSALSAALEARYMNSLVGAAGVVSVFLWLRSFFSMQVGVRASEFLHSRMLSSVFAAPLSFFDATDSGQLLSRFGKETETVDRGVPDSIQSTLFCFLQIFMSMGALAGVVTPAMLLPLAVVGTLYARTMALFRPAARDLKRAEARTRSPIYTHFGEALRGAETIRSVPGAKRVWSHMHRSLTDGNLGVFYTVKAMDRWLSIRLESLGNLVVMIVAMASIYLTRLDRLGAGPAGWGLTQALSITGLLTWAVRCLTDLESNMMSVLRVKELTNVDAEEVGINPAKKHSLMPREPAKAGEALAPLMQNSEVKVALSPSTSDALLRSGWPWRGNVRFKNVSMRYNPTAPLVLRGVSLTVPAGTTLGVVGRTGSGKSSLLLTLFRLMEIEPDGCIEIDGVDIRTLSLQNLRRSLAIIPQDPTLFQGTIASNLDATGQASERDMWIALGAASPSLARQFREDRGLESSISEGGKNLSQGQRQLICLARALLRKSRILVLDEATSSVDSKTDQEVQATIRREFVDKGVTVITVAHRLETVLGYDKIAVLGAGSVLEYGSPKELLQSPNGELYQLVEADKDSKRKGAEGTGKPQANILSEKKLPSVLG